MAVPKMRGSLPLAAFALAFCALLSSAQADEIRLKDGKKLYGVIVAYEDNMFKVKTDFGYVLVEKDKIESIIPSTPAGKTETPAAEKKNVTSPPSKIEDGAPTDSQPPTEAAPVTSSGPAATAANAGTKPASANIAAKTEKTVPKITNAAVKPEVPTSTVAGNVAAPAIKGTPAATANGLAPAAAAPIPPKEPDVPAIQEEIQGN